MALLNVKTAFNIDLQFETASFHLRLFAWIIDLIIMLLYWYGMVYLLDRLFDMQVANELGFVQLFLVTPMLMYHLISELLTKGQSIGKKLLGIKVVSLNGQDAMVSQYLLRWLMRFIDFGLMWGFIFLLQSSVMLGLLLIMGSIAALINYVSSKYNQRLGDKIAGTAIVLKKLPYKLSDTIFQELDVTNYRVNFPMVMRLSDKDLNIIDNIVKQHNKSNLQHYIENVSLKIKTALQIETDMPDDIFLETLLRDYNYLSRK
jgi:uncharacterized RDD family membrane protein YckC